MDGGEKSFTIMTSLLIVILPISLLLWHWRTCNHELEMAKLGYSQEYNGRVVLWVNKKTMVVEEK